MRVFDGRLSQNVWAKRDRENRTISSLVCAKEAPADQKIADFNRFLDGESILLYDLAKFIASANRGSATFFYLSSIIYV